MVEQLQLIKRYIKERTGRDIQLSQAIMFQQEQVEIAYRCALKWYYENDESFKPPITIK